MVTEARTNKEHHSMIRTIIMIVGIIGFCFFLFFTLNFLRLRYQLKQTAYSQAQQKNSVIADYLSENISSLSSLVHTLKDEVEKNGIDRTKITHYLKTKPVSVTGLGLIITQPWYAPYYVEQEDTQSMQDLPQSIMQEAWYQQTIAENKEISGLFFDATTNQPIFYTAAPLHDQKNQLIGLAFATVSMAHIRHVLSTLYTDSTGYRFLLDQKGIILTHPENFWVRTKKNIADLAHYVHQSSITKAVEKAEHSGSSFTHYHNEMTGHASWLFLNKVSATGWLLAGVVDKRELPLSGDFLRHHLLLIITSFIFVLLCALLLLPPLYKHPHHIVLWIISGAVSLLFLFGIASAWILSVQFPRTEKHDFAIESKAVLYTFLQQFENIYKGEQKTILPTKHNDDLNALLTYRYKNKKYIPTGIVINDMQFTTHDQLEFVGFIWQRYFDGMHDDVGRGFILPQATHKTTITEISRTKHEKAETIIWQVQAQINQNLSYKAFPFDIKNINIQLRHKDFEKNMVLVPDLDAYKLINPATLPGIGQDVELNGWHLIKSYFDYELEHYLTNFGLYNYGPFGIYKEAPLEQMPELRLNVVAQRYLLDTILTDLLALCVIAVILFVLLLTYFSEKKFEYILETCAAAFFSSVFAQIQFRSKIVSHEFVYFEIFYFTLYLAIILILITTLIHMFKMNVPIIRYDRNIVTKLLYWPFILSIVWAVTMVYLY